MDKKRAQVGLFETIMVLVVFFFLLMMGMSIYQKFQLLGFKEKKVLLREQRAADLVKIILSMPELQCSADNIITPNCLDKIKVIKFYDWLELDPDLRLYYSTYLLNSNATIKQVYPPPEDPAEGNWTIYERKYSESREVTPYFLPILLYDPTGAGSCSGLKGGCIFGVVRIAAYG